MKAKIAKWYKFGIWTAPMVRNAVDKGLISEADYYEIVGSDYE